MSQSTQRATRREGLKYASGDDVIADVQRLRKGYAKTGNWSLLAICWHLETATRFRMVPGPFPPNTPEQDARKERLREILTTATIPSGIEAPTQALPPSNVDDSAIDALIATLKKFDSFPGPIAPHRRFGNLSDSDARQLNLIHCAHHLSYLVPTT
jgi:hypothetical protein